MLNNLVHRHDLLALAERGPALAARILGRLFSTGHARTRDAWRHTTRPPSAWNDIPAVRARWNLQVSGDPGIDTRHHVLRTHLDGREGLRAISLGCGSESIEIGWAETGRFTRLDAWDLSPDRIAYAREQACTVGVDDIVRFHAGDAMQMPLVPGAYDLVLAQGSLHHFSPLELVLERAAEALAPTGLLLVEDFVSPTRFQWSARQIEAVNAMLALLPVPMLTLRRAPGQASRPKRPVFVPSRMRMWLADPSEAVESGRIMQLLRRCFEVVEPKQIGGGPLHLLLNGIAHHFLSDDEATRRWLKLCFETEDMLMESGELPSDFALAVYRKKPTGNIPDNACRDGRST